MLTHLVVAADALASDTDNGVGYGIEDAEDNTANNINAVKSGGTPSTVVTRGTGTNTGGSGISTEYQANSSSPPVPQRRQLDKIASTLNPASNRVLLETLYTC